MSGNSKDVVYVDVDDEITAIIDKVASSKSKIVALVLPKRATVFQSVVNMKLLKKRADTAGKQAVLITSESNLMPLAGGVGLYVAKTLQSKPEIPAALAAATAAVDSIDEAGQSTGEFDAQASGDQPIGDLAGEPSPLNTDSTPEDTIEIDNTDATPTAGSDKDVRAIAAYGASGKAGGKKGKNKKLKVPNFDKFRLKLVLGALILAALIAGWILANNVLPKANVTIQTDTSNVNSSLTPTLDTNASSANTASQVLPAKVESVQKTYNGQAPASGKKNIGNKATGSVTLNAQACAPNLGTPNSIPAGSGLSANGLTFITQSDANFTFSGFSGGSCADYTSGPVNITAQNGGSQYNLSNATFSVAGTASVTGTGSSDGGTDNIVTVVQQSDIDTAKQQANQAANKDVIKAQLQQTLQNDGEYAITATFSSGNPQITTSAKVGDQVSTVTYTEVVNYTMFGVQKSDLDQLIAASVDQQIDTTKQAIQDDGLANAVITMPDQSSSTKAKIDIQVTSVIGPHLDQNALKKSIEGAKSGEARSIIKGYPGVQDVNVVFSPFWVDTVPKNPSKITLVFKKSSTNNNGQ
jgi:hypothetical protein